MKADSLLSVAPPRASPDFSLFRPCVRDRHVTPGTPWRFALTTTLPAQPPIHQSHPRSPPHYLYAHDNPRVCILQLFLPTHELRLLFLEDSEAWEVILAPRGLRRVCNRKGFE